MAGTFPFGASSVTAQVAIALVGVGGVAVAPPAVGVMVVIPYDGAQVAGTIDRSLAAGASLLSTGTLPGSIVVRGERTRLIAAFAGRHVLFLAVPASTCGS